MFAKIESLIDVEESSIVNAEAFVKWKMSNNIYNFKTLPETAILSVFPTRKRSLSFFLRKPVKGIKGKNFLASNKKIVLCTECGYGAPYIVNLCEELRVLGVRNFVFIGLAGTFTKSIKEGDLLYVNKTFSGVGTSYYYNKNETIIPVQSDWNKALLTSLNTKSVTCWSTDAPFRESVSLKKYYEEKGAEIVEMECAAVYAFANYYNLNASCFTIISDQLTDEWSPPMNYKSLIDKEKEVIASVINLL